MTSHAGGGFRLGGTALDRAGGALRLVSIADELVGRTWSLRILDTGATLRLVVEHYPEGTDPDAIEAGVAAGMKEIEIREVQLARSAAVRTDQEALVVDDRRELEPILRSAVDQRTYARLPELEKRAINGDR